MSDIKTNIDNAKHTPQTTKEWLIELRGMLTAWWIPFIMTVCLVLFFAIASIPVVGLPLAAAYIVYMLIDKSHDGGNMRSDRMKSWIPVQDWMAQYFNLQIIKEAELDPKENYIFAYHPHGIISFGFQCAIYRFQNNFEQIFNGIKISLLTLNMNFFIPLYREYCLLGGMNSASKQSIKRILSKGPGHSVGLVVGGAAEAMYAKPELARLVIKKRMGFVKLAIQTGAHLVPIYAFGENQMYDLEENHSGFYKWIYKFNRTVFGTTTPLFVGRGFREGSKGGFPFKVPITLVVGDAIKVTKNPNPTPEEIQKVHQIYLDRLTDLYNRNKDKYHPGGNPPELEFVEK